MAVEMKVRIVGEEKLARFLCEVVTHGSTFRATAEVDKDGEETVYEVEFTGGF